MNSKQIGKKEFVRAVRSALAFADAYMPQAIAIFQLRIEIEQLSDDEKEEIKLAIDEVERDYLEIQAVMAHLEQIGREVEQCESECH